MIKCLDKYESIPELTAKTTYLFEIEGIDRQSRHTTKPSYPKGIIFNVRTPGGHLNPKARSTQQKAYHYMLDLETNKLGSQSAPIIAKENIMASWQNNSVTEDAINMLARRSGLKLVGPSVLPTIDDHSSKKLNELLKRCKESDTQDITTNSGKVLVDEAIKVIAAIYSTKTNKDLVMKDKLIVPVGDTKYYFDGPISTVHYLISMIEGGMNAVNNLGWTQQSIDLAGWTSKKKRGPTMTDEDYLPAIIPFLIMGKEAALEHLMKSGSDNKTKRIKKRILMGLYKHTNDPDYSTAAGNEGGNKLINQNQLDYLIMSGFLKAKIIENDIKLAAILVTSIPIEAAFNITSKSVKHVHAYKACLAILHHKKLTARVNPLTVPGFTMTTKKCHRIIINTAIHLGQTHWVTSVEDLAFTQDPEIAVSNLKYIFDTYRNDIGDLGIFKLAQIARNTINGINLCFNFGTGGLLQTVASSPKGKYYATLLKNGTTAGKINLPNLGKLLESWLWILMMMRSQPELHDFKLIDHLPE